MMVASWSAEVFRHNRDADELLIVDPPWWVAKRNAGLSLAARVASWHAFGRAILAIRRHRFDLLVELRGDVRHIVAFGCLGGVRHIVTYRRNGGHFLADLALPACDERHEIAQGTDLVARLGGAPVPALPPMPALHGPAESARIMAMLRASGITADPVLVVIHPGAKAVNRWPLERFAELVTRLHRRENVRVVVTGSAAEAPLAEKLRLAAPACVIPMAGRLSLLEMAALLELADAFVCGDTGPMHLLNAARTPAVLLFGPTQPARFAPLTRHHVVVRGRACCDAALHDVCHSRPGASYSACMESIRLDSVAAALEPMLERALARRSRPPSPSSVQRETTP
jgi:ADP-heptose:LPS heptosyltransferase